MAESVRRSEPDHILALWALPSGWWAKVVGRQFEIPYSTWALGSDIWSLGRIPVIRRVLASVLQNASNRYADGFGLSRDVETISKKACSFLPSSRRLTACGPTNSSDTPGLRLAFLGRWHTNKGVDLLMNALRRLTDADWERIEAIRINGGGPLEREVNSIASELEAAGRPVSVGGYLDRQQAAELICWADYLLLPSRIESIPVVFSDAMQLRTPLIATPVGDLPTLFDKYEFGTLADDATVKAFAVAIQKTLGKETTGSPRGLETAAQDFDVASSASRFLQDIEYS